MFTRTHVLFIFIFSLILQIQATDIEITTYKSYVVADSLWQNFYSENEIPSGITNLSVEFTSHYAEDQVGSFKNIPEIGNYKMSDGIVLSTGNAIDCVGPNDKAITSGENGFPGEPDINAAIGYDTYDAAIININFTSDHTIQGFTFNYTFGSEEYPSYVGSKFADAFVVLLDGRNICLDSDGKIISINNTFFNIDNNSNPSINLQWNGFTYVMQISASLTPGSHSLKFAVADVSDYRIDSGVFLSNFKFTLDSLSCVPLIEIGSNQTFSAPPSMNSKTVISQLENRSLFSPVTLTQLTETDKFEIDNWNIVARNDITLPVNSSYSVMIEGKLDTMWNGQKWTVLDTFTIAVIIDPTNNISAPVRKNKATAFISNSILNITIPNTYATKINASIFNLQGKCIFSNAHFKISHKNTLQLNTEELSKGSYICRITSGNSYKEEIMFQILK